MSTDLSNDFRETVRSHTDIVALIGEAVAVQSRNGGREFVGLCPFHDDHNPSMRIYPDRQTFRCWSCNTGGDCFTFVMEREKIEFREALEILARRAHLEIPKQLGGRSKDEEDSRARMFEVLQWAENLFHQTLLKDPSAQPARDYLKQRGIPLEIIKQFRIGYHPKDWKWLQAKAAGTYSNRLLLAARLIGEKEGRTYDYFVDRVLFSIRNERSQPVAFGGRILPGSNDGAKYWNSPESPVFHKSRLLYGIDQARDAIRELDTVLIVEGYTDCIALHQYGIKNVVGTLGTALTDSHVVAAKRFARQVVLVFDGDNAGQTAAARAVEIFLRHDVDLRVLTLPGGADPAEFLADQGREAFQQLAAKAPEAWVFQFQTSQQRHGLTSIDSRHRVLEEMLQLLSAIPAHAENVREGLLLANLCQRLGVREEQARERLKELRGNSRNQQRRLRVDTQDQTPSDEATTRLLRGQPTRDDRLACDLLEMLLSSPEYARFVIPRVAASSLVNPRLRSIYDMMAQQWETDGQVTFEGVMNRLHHPNLIRLAVWLDEQSRVKDLATKLRDEAADTDGCPLLLRRSIANLQWRREEQSHEKVALRLSQSGDGSQGLDAETEALLRQAADFHLRRATTKSSPGHDSPRS